jgi:hypothetical protein
VMLSLGWLAFATHRAYLTLTARLVLER